MNALKKILLGEQGLVVIFAIAFVIVSLTVPSKSLPRNVTTSGSRFGKASNPLWPNWA